MPLAARVHYALEQAGTLNLGAHRIGRVPGPRSLSQMMLLFVSNGSAADVATTTARSIRWLCRSNWNGMSTASTPLIV